jgi:hypothetical protein
MAKKPRDAPEKVGQRVQLRGRHVHGTIEFLKEDWAWIKWDTPKSGPRICSVYELRVAEH